MHRFVASAALLSLASLLPACSTLAGHEVHENVLEMRMDGAKVSFIAPAHCTLPGYQVDLQPGAGIRMSLTDATFHVEVEPGRSLVFTSTTGRIESPDGTVSDLAIARLKAIRDEHSAWTVVPADTPMAGIAPPGQRSTYLGDFDWRRPAAQAFTVQLPDAVVNGQPYRFAPIRFSVKPYSYFEDACLR